MKRICVIIAFLAMLGVVTLWVADVIIRRQHSRYIHCRSCFRQIDSAKEQIAMFDDLQPGGTVVPSDLIACTMPSVTNCVSGGTISIGRIGEDPEAS